jgi:hypothetical protein
MKKAALAALLLVLVPLQARALETNELLGLVAMPLAVAAASEATGVPASELSHFVATLNRAQVPPTQVVQVVRYAPAALVIEDQQPTFIEYVDTRVDDGVTGSQLVTAIEDRYRTYELDPQFYSYEEPATTYVVRDDFIPDLVVTRVSQVQPAYVVNDTNDLLALAAMPLAVAAVADLTGVPFGDLTSFVSTLNAARVPPVQMVEVLRYTPVVFIDATERPQFVQYVRTRYDDGISGLRLVNVIEDRYRTYDIDPQFGSTEVFDDDRLIPAVVTTRVAEARAHPHGGPPGQLKKQLGLQTGAEVVHGAARGSASVARKARAHDDRRVTRRVRSDDERRVTRKAKPERAERRVVSTPRTERRVEQVVPQREVRQPREPRQPRVEKQHRGRGNSDGGGQAHGNSGHGGGGKGNGKGKGKG